MNKDRNKDRSPRCSFNDENRLNVVKALGYYRMRLQQGQLAEWEVKDLVETLETIEGSLLRVWPLLMEIAAQPFLDGSL